MLVVGDFFKWLAGLLAGYLWLRLEQLLGLVLRQADGLGLALGLLAQAELVLCVLDVADEDHHDLLGAGDIQGTLALHVLEVNASVLLIQQLSEDVVQAVGGGQVDRRVAVSVLGVDVGLGVILEHSLHNSDAVMGTFAGDVQQGRGLRVLRASGVLQ